MLQNAEIVLEGTYSYFKKDVSYSQENFKLLSFKDNSNVHLYSEVLSRLETGEFLKILVRYEMNSQFIPLLVKIDKTLGNKYAQEIFEVNPGNGELFYKFQSAEKSQEFKRTFNSRHCIATPAFCTTAIFSFAKKFEPGLRIPVSIISTDNVWDYQGPPKEKVVYIEAKSKDKDDFLAEKLPIDSSLFYLHENASASTIQDPPVELVISRDHCIPYQMTFLDQKIVFHQSKKRDQTLK